MEQKDNALKSKAPKRKTKREVEISPEALAERATLTGFIFGNTEDLVKKDKERRESRAREEFELRSGVKISLQQIQDFVTASLQPYSVKFPNNNPFFHEMYRLLGWKDKDPNDFNKPACVGGFINELIYHRFNKDVLPTLQVMAMPGGVRLHKFFQFLNEEGQKLVEQYRDEAIEVMKKSNTWYDFRLAYAQKYSLPVQLKFRRDM